MFVVFKLSIIWLNDSLNLADAITTQPNFTNKNKNASSSKSKERATEANGKATSTVPKTQKTNNEDSIVTEFDEIDLGVGGGGDTRVENKTQNSYGTANPAENETATMGGLNW